MKISILKFFVRKDRLLYNVSVIKSKINSSKVCAVVKANAYGHGVDFICTSLLGAVDYFAVANVDEGKIVRSCVGDFPVLVLGEIQENEIETAVENQLEISVGSIEKMLILSNLNQKIAVHIKVDTGMNRCGVKAYAEFAEMLDVAKSSGNIKVCGIYSHLNNTADYVYTGTQIEKFDEFQAKCKSIFPDCIAHLSNSGGIINNYDCYYDMVRVGIMLYGYMGEQVKGIGEFISQVILIKHIKKGEFVGYDNTFQANCDMTVAVVRGGYADGINVLLSNKQCVTINGKKCLIVGRINMDMFSVDVTGTDVRIGDKVEIFGDENTLSDLILDTTLIPYEVVTALGNRVERIYE